MRVRRSHHSPGTTTTALPLRNLWGSSRAPWLYSYQLNRGAHTDGVDNFDRPERPAVVFANVVKFVDRSDDDANQTPELARVAVFDDEHVVVLFDERFDVIIGERPERFQLQEVRRFTHLVQAILRFGDRAAIAAVADDADARAFGAEQL